MRALNAGLPFFDNIDKQGRYAPYFNSNIRDWICPKNRLPAFQFATYQDDNQIDEFDLINADTGATVDYLTWFNTGDNVDVVDREIYGYYFIHGGNIAVTLTTGRYYLYAKSSEDRERWSEVFVVTNLEE